MTARAKRTHKAVESGQEDKLASAKQQAQAQFNSIVGMVQRLEIAEEQAQTGSDETDAARQDIEESPLEVLVRCGWYNPSAGKI